MISPYITLIKRITEGRPSESGFYDGHVIKAEKSYTWSGTDTTRVIESIQFDGGYFDSGSGANYYVRDYLGNIIAVVNQGGHLVQATDYYPYGLLFRMPDIEEDNNATAETGDTGSGSTSNRYLFGGKEFLTEDGLNEYYQEARQYIPRIPRFDRMDDKIDDYRDFTPYLAFGGNPIMCVDPDGKDAVLVVEDNKITVIANIILTGNRATDRLARIYKNDIMSKWGSVKTFAYEGETYNVTWKVDVRVKRKNEAENYNGVNNYMEVIDNSTESGVELEMNRGVLRGEGRQGLSLVDDCPMSHEFGHLLGLADKYKTDPQNPNQQKPISSEWTKDIMARPANLKSEIKSKTLTIIFKGILDKHKQSLGVIFSRFFPNIGQLLRLNRTIEERNKNNREPRP